MGSGIAACLAGSGLPVTFLDSSEELLARAVMWARCRLHKSIAV
jgi:3-hydroxyacyl-CoA dehydrogenase